MKKALITGASSGIGAATARAFAKQGYDLLLTARREERLKELTSKLQDEFNVQVKCLVMDVQVRDAVEQQLDALDPIWRKIDVLVNNAGLSLGLEPFYEGNTDDWDQMLNTNVKGLLYVSRVVSNWMIENGKGHIINIGSIAGKESYANGNVYCASKAAVDSLSKSMRIDLLPHGIKVTAIHPGAAETEFSQVRFKGDQQRAANVYKGFEPLHAEDIADVILYTANLPAHVNINDLVLMPTAQANASTIQRSQS